MQHSTRDDRPPPMPVEADPHATAQGAGALYRQHLERFPERQPASALERAARALIRAAQIRLRAPRKAN
jgi:hypothetical protein